MGVLYIAFVIARLVNLYDRDDDTSNPPEHPRHRLWRPPHLHQNHPEVEGKETWLELFYDLVYVAVLIQLGNILSDDVSWMGAARFAVLFAPIWWAWSNFTFYMNRFVVDDVWHRLIVMLQIFCIAWLGSSVGGAFAVRKHAVCAALHRTARRPSSCFMPVRCRA